MTAQTPMEDLDAATWTFAALIGTLRDALERPLGEVLAASPQRSAVLEAAGLLVRDADGGAGFVGDIPQGPAPLEAKLSSLRQAVAAAAGEGASGGGWASLDDEVLLNQGRASAATGNAIARRIVPELAGLGDSLANADSRILDVGTGIGAIATELARAFPHSRVVGIDIFDRALKLAEERLPQELADRVTLRHLDVAELAEPDGYDLIWLPVPFIGEPLLEKALLNTVAALRPRGWLVTGTNPPAADPVRRAVGRWNAVRNGGNSFDTDAVEASLSTCGLRDLRRFPTVPGGPILVAGQRG